MYIPRLILGLVTCGFSLTMAIQTARDRARFRRQGLNGEVAHACAGRFRRAVVRALIGLMLALTALAPSRVTDRAVIFGVGVVVFWLAIYAFRERREAEIMAADRLMRERPRRRRS